MGGVKGFSYYGVAVLALLGVGLVAACTAPSQPAPSGQEPSAQAPAQTPAQAEVAGKPKYGGTLVVMGDPTGQGADYHSTTSISMIEAFSNIHATVLELSPDDRVTVRGYLATSWQVSADGKTFTFKIREGLTTHKGKPFTAEDVAYSVYRMVERPGRVTGARTGCLRAVVKRVTAPDPTTVVIELKEAVASFIPCMTNPYLAIQPKYVVETVDRENRIMQPEEIDGVGAFKVKEWVEGSILKTARFDGYHIAGRPYLDEIHHIALPDPASQIAAFRTERAHQFGGFATTPTPSEAKVLKAEFGDKITVAQVPAPGFRGYHINTDRPPLNDIRVREAIDLAVNRQTHLELYYEGAGFLSGPYYGGWDWIYSFEEMSKWPGYRADKTEDLKRARELLKEAGYQEGLTIDNIVCGTGATSDDCELLVEDLKKVGITAKLFRVRTVLEIARKFEHNMVVDGGGLEVEDPDSYNLTFFHPTAGRKWTRFEDREWLKLYEQQRVELDQQKRGQLLRKMSDIIWNSHEYIFTNRPILHQTWWSYVKGYVPPKNFYQTSYRRDAVWLDRNP